MPRNPSHRNALKPQNMNYNERAERVNKRGVMNATKNIDKLFPEDDTTLVDCYSMMQHGNNISQKMGRPLSYASVEEFERQVGEFFMYCHEHKIVPTRPALANWLGVNSGTLLRWSNDETNPFSFSIKKADEVMHQFMLQKTMEGSINTILYFFIAKNWFGMSDKTEIVHRSTSNGIDLDEQQRIINSTPGIVIDAKIVESEPRSENLGTNIPPEDLDAQEAENLALKTSAEDLGDLEAENLEDLLIGDLKT